MNDSEILMGIGVFTILGGACFIMAAYDERDRDIDKAYSDGFVRGLTNKVTRVVEETGFKEITPRYMPEA